MNDQLKKLNLILSVYAEINEEREQPSRMVSDVITDLRLWAEDQVATEADHDRLRITVEQILSPRSAHMQRDAIRDLLREALGESPEWNDLDSVDAANLTWGDRS